MTSSVLGAYLSLGGKQGPGREDGPYRTTANRRVTFSQAGELEAA